jgi:hypothetical protein
MKVYFYKFEEKYHAITEHGYSLFPISGASLDEANYIYLHLNYVIEKRGDTGEAAKRIWVSNPKTHQHLCAAILRARVMGDPVAERYSTSTWRVTEPFNML